MLQSQPLASYVHCIAHCSNLIASAVCLSSQVVYNSIQLVNEFGVLCNASEKFKSIFVHIASDSDHRDLLACSSVITSVGDMTV